MRINTGDRAAGSSMRSDPSIAARLDELRERVTEGPGRLPSSVRRAAVDGGPVPPEAQAYTDKVRRHAYKVVDEDVAELEGAGWSEDQIFEITIAAAVGQGLSRLERARALMKEAGL